MDPPTKQMSQLHIQDIAPPDPLLHKRVSSRLTQATRNASIPTWGQIKTLCPQAREIASLQGSPASPEKMFIVMLALLSCQVSASPIPTKYWAYLPDPPTFQVITWNNVPIRVNTDQPLLLGGSYTSYTRDKYPINFNYTFRGLTGDFPVCFNFPNDPRSFITLTKEGCVGASKKIIITDSWSSRHRSACVLLARMPGILDPYVTLHFKSPPKYPNCYKVVPSDKVWNTIDSRTGCPTWTSCTYDSRIDYRIPGGGDYTIQDWSNPNPGEDPLANDTFEGRFEDWDRIPLPWPIHATRRHRNQFVPPMLSYTTKKQTYWQPEIWRTLAATAPVSLYRPDSNSTYSILACLPSPYVFLFTNDSKRLNVCMNYSGGPNIVTCEQCMLSSCLTPQYNVCSFMVLQCPPYLMVPVTVTTQWYDNYGLAVL